MTTTFLSLKRGSRLSLRSPSTWSDFNTPGSSPRFSLSNPPGAVMKINPLYKDVPALHEKLKVLKQTIISDRATLATWEVSEPDYPLLIKVKDQLEANLRIWANLTEGQPCQ